MMRRVVTVSTASGGFTRNMFIVARISMILVSQYCVLAKCKPTTEALKGSSLVAGYFTSRSYLPATSPKNRARSSDIDAVLENDLQVLPLAVDHDQRNGFQYQPIISHQYSRGFTESPRYSQSADPDVPWNGNTRPLSGSPISNGNALKPITKSQLSREDVACVAPKGNNPETPWCFGRIQSPGRDFDRVSSLSEGSSRQKIFTANDQENNIQRERLRLQLTPPRAPGIPETSSASETNLEPVGIDPWSKGMISNGGQRGDVKPIVEDESDDGEVDGYRHGAAGYQFRTPDVLATPTPKFLDDSFKHSYVVSSKKICGNDHAFRWLLQRVYPECNIGYNSQQHLPPDPVLALLLSHYGRYLPGIRTPRVYAYMAVNNIHNNKPFGSYRLTQDD